MFDRLDDILIRFEELLQELNNPSVVEDQAKFRRLMKEQTELSPVVDAYKAVSYTHLDVYKRQVYSLSRKNSDICELDRGNFTCFSI